jgi:hypothetical protein
MAKEPLTITLDPASELARALTDANAQVVIDSDGVRYTVAREDVFARYDPEAARRGLRGRRGALKGVDVEELLADLKRAAELGLELPPDAGCGVPADITSRRLIPLPYRSGNGSSGAFGPLRPKFGTGPFTGAAQRTPLAMTRWICGLK